MNFKNEVIKELKKLGFKKHKDFHSAMYVWNENNEIIAYCEPKFFKQDSIGCLIVGFVYAKYEGLGYYIGTRSANNKRGYNGCYEDYTLVHGGEITQDITFVNGIDITSWDTRKKDNLFKYMKNEMIDFIRKGTTKKNFEKLALKKGADIAAIIYEERGELDKTIEILERDIGVARAWQDIYSLRKTAYLDFLKNGTPLPDIKDPEENTSVFELIGNDIYIAINKKAIKNENILEYFGGIDNFEKPQKITYEDMVNETGISICKAGKWSVLRVGLDIFMNYTQKDLEQLLLTLSEKYSRSILLVNQDTSGTFGFEVYKKGEFIRRWMAGDGEVMENLGKPIIGEKKRFLDALTKEQDAESVVSFLDNVLKINYGDLEKSKTLLYDVK